MSKSGRRVGTMQQLCLPYAILACRLTEAAFIYPYSFCLLHRIDTSDFELIAAFHLFLFVILSIFLFLVQSEPEQKIQVLFATLTENPLDLQ
ncbi:hypothetical protein BKA65DRAFT_270466 [Rhexocercosporidium sp. MPI-PUGE-AT-0058]|nr:hypothetical protein BKA65DRAFT_270466 [Rhexocercosporidium sp. MPI-PUGE-AT-0058]